jgi:hypothetical protein
MATDQDDGLVFELGLSFAFMLVSFAAAYYYLLRRPVKVSEPKKETNSAAKGTPADKKGNSQPSKNSEVSAAPKVAVPLRIVYGTSTGQSKKFAAEIERDVFAMSLAPRSCDGDGARAGGRGGLDGCQPSTTLLINRYDDSIAM